MLKKIMNKLREVAYRMKLIKGLGSITSLSVAQEAYDRIETYKKLYAGFCKDIHQYNYLHLGTEKTRKLSSLKMPKVSAAKMATLVFNEKVEFNFSDDNLETYVMNVLKDNKFERNMRTQFEYMFALGGMAVEGFYDDGIKLNYIKADSFVPLAWNAAGDISEAAIVVSTSTKGTDRYTLVRFHTWDGPQYVITNKLFRSASTTDGELGVEVSLGILYPELEAEVRIDNLDRPLFEYAKPNTANNLDLDSPLGIPLYANAIDTIKALDTAFDSYYREFRLGKKKIIVPATVMKTNHNTETGVPIRYFDTNDEVYEAMNFGDSMEGMKPHEISMALRVKEHIDGINGLLSIFASQTGFSPNTFVFDGQGVKTATEVVSENSETFRTKQTHEQSIETLCRGVVEIILQLSSLYGEYQPPLEWSMSLQFDDSIAEDKATEITNQTLLLGSGLTSKRRAIMKTQGVTWEEAEEILKEILEESRSVTSGQVDMMGIE